MIWESSVWKKELKKELKGFRSFLKNDGNPDTEYFDLKIEKFHFICAYIMRKLIEAYKVSDELRSKNYKCRFYDALKHELAIDFLNCHHIDGDLYSICRTHSS